MDGPEIPYREKFEKLATRKGEIVALVSGSDGDLFALGEKYLLRAYMKALAHNESMPDDMKELSAHDMDVDQEARAAIQAYKLRHGIPLDTPPVSEAPQPRSGNAANEDIYASDF